MPRKKRINPFYVLLVIAGVGFCITACAYGVMAVRQMRGTGDPMTPLERFMDRNGVVLLGSELGILGVATFLAIGTDRFWSGDDE